MKKIKKILLTLVLMVVGALALFQENSVEAAPAATPSVTMDIKTYNGDVYDEAATWTWPGNIGIPDPYPAMPEFTKEQAESAITNYQTTGGSNPMVWPFIAGSLGNMASFTPEQVIALLDITAPALETQTEFTPGERITVEITNTYSENSIRSTAFEQNVPANLWDQASSSTDVKHNSYSMSTAAIVVANGVHTLKFGFTESSGVAGPTKYAYSFTIADGFSGQFTFGNIALDKDRAGTMFSLPSGQGYTHKADSTHFQINTATINVIGASSESDLSSLKINNTDVLSEASNDMIGATPVKKITVPSASVSVASGSTINIKPTVVSGGTIAKVSMGTSAAGAKDADSINGTTLSGYNIDLSDATAYPPGGKVYVYVETLASDGNLDHNTKYILEIEIERSSDKDLQSISIIYGEQTKTFTYDNDQQAWVSDSGKFAYSSTQTTFKIRIGRKFEYQTVTVGQGPLESNINTSLNFTNNIATTQDITISPNPTSAVSQNYYAKVVAQNGTYSTWEIIFEREAADSNNNLSSLIINNQDGTIGALYNSANTTAASFAAGTTEYTYRISSNVTTINFTATFGDLQRAKIKYANNNEISLTSGTVQSIISSAFQSGESIQITVTAQNGQTKEYKFKINVISADATINGDPEFSLSTGETLPTTSTGDYSYNVSGLPFSTSFFNIKVDLKSGQTAVLTQGTTTTTISDGVDCRVSFNGTTNASQTIPYTLKVTSAAGTVQEYTINVTRDAPSSDKSFSSVEVTYNNSTQAGELDSGYRYKLPHNFVYSTISQFSVQVTLTDSSIQRITIGPATSPGGNTNGIYTGNFTTSVAEQTVTVYFIVKAQDNSTQEYTIEIKRDPADTEHDLANLSIKDNNDTEIGTWDTNAQTYTVNGSLQYSISSVKAVAELPSGSKAKVRINSVERTTFNIPFSTTGSETVTFTIEVVSESGGTNARTITVPVTRDGANNDATFTIEAKDAEGNNINVTISSSSSTADRTLPFSNTYVTFKIIPNVSTTSIKIGNSDFTNREYRYEYPEDQAASSDGITTIQIITQAGSISGGAISHTISFPREAADNNFELDGQFEVKDLYLNPYAPTTIVSSTYKYSIPRSNAPDSKFYIYAELPTGSKAKIYTTTNSNDFGNFDRMNLYDASIGYDIGAYDSPNTVYLIVYSEYGLINPGPGHYKVHSLSVAFTDERSTDSVILDIVPTAGNYNFSVDNTAPTMSVGFDVSTIGFAVTLHDSTASLLSTTSSTRSELNNKAAYNDITGTTRVNLNVGANVIYIQAKAQNDTPSDKIYKFTITRANPSTDNYILTAKVNPYDLSSINTGVNYTEFSPYLGELDIALARSTVTARFEITVSPYASYEVRFGNAVLATGTNTSSISNSITFSVNSLVAGAKNVVTISVKSQADTSTNGTANIYTFNVYKVDQTFGVSNIEVLSQDESNSLEDINGANFAFTAGTLNPPTFTLPYSISAAVLRVTVAANAPNAVISGDGLKNLTANQDTTWTITIKSEYASLNPNITDQTVTYTVKLHRNPADTVNTLATLSAKIDGTEYITNFNPDGTEPYAISDIPNSATQITITATAASNLATITGDIGTIRLDLINNNSQTFTINVNSESGSNKTYKIIVSTQVIVLDPNNSISNITASDSEGTPHINYSATTLEYAVNIPARCTSVTIVATSSVTVSSIYIAEDGGQASQTNTQTVRLAPNESKEITIYCISQSGVQGDTYTINVTRDGYNQDPTLSSLTFNGTLIPGFNPTSNQEYTINVENNVTTGILGYTTSATTTNITYNNATSENPFALTVGENILQITSQAEDTSITKTYTVKVIRDDVNTLSSLTAIRNEDTTGTSLFTFNGQDIINLDSLPYTTSKLDIASIANGTNVTLGISLNGSTVSNSGNATIDLIEGNNTIVVSVTTASGATKEYTINVTRQAGLTDYYIETYVDEEGRSLAGLNKTQFEYTYNVGRNIQSFNPNITVSSGATPIMPRTTVLNVGLNVFTITVKSETGVERPYTFNVYKNEAIFSINDINVLTSRNGTDVVDVDGVRTVQYAEQTYIYNLTVAHSVQNIFLDVIKDGLYGTIFVNNVVYSTSGLHALQDGLNTFTIYVTSEYGMANAAQKAAQTCTPYVINITREEANGDATLSSLEIMSNGVDLLTTENASATFDPLTKTYTIQNVGNITSVLIKAEKNHTSATILSGTGNKALAQLSDSTGQITGYVFRFTVNVRAENGNEEEYVINISRGPIDLDEDNSILYIKVTDSNGVEYLGQRSFETSTLSYEFDIPFSVQAYTIEVVKTTPISPATATGTGQFTVTSNMYGTQVTHSVYLTSESGQNSSIYEIKINISEPSSENKLKDIKIDGVLVPNFDPENFVYNLGTIPNNKTSLDVTYTLKDGKSTATLTNPNPLAEGQNTISIVVTAEDGSTQLYTMSVVRDYPLPYLTNLEGVGERLLDESDKATTFDRNTYTYHFVVTFLVLQMNFNASVDNKDHIVVCSNATLADLSTENTRVFNAILNEGINTFTFVVTSIEGKSQTYTVVVQRRGASSTNTNIDVNQPIKIENLPDFTDDFSNLVTSYGPYQVAYSVTSVGNISLVLENGAASYEVFNETLAVGNNRVIILITAEDKITTRAIVVNVERADVEIEIDEEAYEEFKPEATEKENVFTIDLGDKRASAITDYKKFLNMSDADKAASTIEVLSDTSREDCSEVVIRVTDVNGSTSQTYTFQLASTSINTGSQGISWYVWLVLGIVVILLIIILICVNRDKYGSILKKRKRANS